MQEIYISMREDRKGANSVLLLLPMYYFVYFLNLQYDEVFDDFQKIYDHFPKIFKMSGGHTNVSEHFPKIS